MRTGRKGEFGLVVRMTGASCPHLQPSLESDVHHVILHLVVQDEQAVKCGQVYGRIEGASKVPVVLGPRKRVVVLSNKALSPVGSTVSVIGRSAEADRASGAAE